jgi:hypothetical protein
MRNASVHRFAGHWPKEKAVGSLTLDFDLATELGSGSLPPPSHSWKSGTKTDIS